MDTQTGKPSTIALEGRGGSIIFRPIEVIGETPTRYKIRLVEDIKIPDARQYKEGEVLFVPKAAVTLYYQKYFGVGEKR